MSDDEKAKYHLLLHEHRERLRGINVACKELRNRMLLFLTADLAVLAYCFTNAEEYLPAELYGVIFFALGVASLIASVCVITAFLCIVKPWSPTEIPDIQHLDYEKEILQATIQSYQSSCENAQRKLARQHLIANLALLLFLIGAIIVIIIKIF